MTSRLNISLLLLLFLVAVLPFAATFAFYYPDERHYSDSAMGILKDHDWLAPKTARGELRTQKPPLACWSIAASYTVLGPSAFAERLPFLLAGCATLFLTYHIARRLTGKQTTALLAAAILASHPQFFLSCTRGIPDAFQTLFMTLSLYGFMRLIVLGETSAGAFWIAYGGAILAFQSKGLFGIAVIAFAWIYAWRYFGSLRAVTKIIHGPGLALFVVLSAGWFIYVCWRFGQHGLHVFYADQITGNVRGHWWLFLARPFIYVGILLVNFLPWSPTALEWLLWKKFKPTGDVPPAAQRFILVWLGILFVILACCENVSMRYLLPATPLLAVLLADWLENMAGTKLIFSLRRVLLAGLIGLALFVLLAIWTVSQWEAAFGLVAGLGIIFAAVVWIAWNSFARENIPAGEGLMLAVFLAALTLFVAIMPVLLPGRATQMADALRQTPRIERQVLFIGSIQMGSRLRVELGREWDVQQRDYLIPGLAQQFKTLLVPERYLAPFLHNRWQIQVAASEPNLPDGKKLLRAILQRNLPEMLQANSQRYYLASHP